MASGGKIQKRTNKNLKIEPQPERMRGGGGVFRAGENNAGFLTT